MKLQQLDYAVLAFAASRSDGISQYDLKREINDDRAPLLGASVSGARKSLLKLAGEACLNTVVTEQPAKDGQPRPAKTRYTLALRGRSELEAWAAKPARTPTVNESELQVRLRAMSVIGAQRTLEALIDIADDLAMAILLSQDEPISADSEIGARLEFDLLHALYWTYSGWLDRAIRELTIEATREQIKRLAGSGDVVEDRIEYERRIKRIAERVARTQSPPSTPTSTPQRQQRKAARRSAGERPPADKAPRPNAAERRAAKGRLLDEAADKLQRIEEAQARARAREIRKDDR